jgi:hypothetical protein
MRQIRITTADLCPPSDDDCYLSPDDPIHEFKKVSMMGGLGSEQALANYMNSQLPTIVGSDKGRIAREQGIKTGTEEWFEHWFGRNDQ